MAMMTLLAAMAMGGETMGIPTGPGYHRGNNRKPRNMNNDPGRAKGMHAFDIDGVTIYAGTLKAAHKKANLLRHSQA
jgi:hypothetical protein